MYMLRPSLPTLYTHPVDYNTADTYAKGPNDGQFWTLVYGTAVKMNALAFCFCTKRLQWLQVKMVVRGRT